MLGMLKGAMARAELLVLRPAAVTLEISLFFKIQSKTQAIGMVHLKEHWAKCRRMRGFNAMVAGEQPGGLHSDETK